MKSTGSMMAINFFIDIHDVLLKKLSDRLA